ncbi:MAG: response regulator [Acidobacteria bacterium]|nr:response regulator [Acidobacteriota bacterium]
MICQGMDAKGVMLVCPACLNRKTFALNLTQMRRLVHKGSIEFHCSFCAGRRPWRLARPMTVSELWYEKPPECKNILLVDDDDLYLKLLERILGMFEARVDIACDGKQGLEKLTGTDYDLVILDIRMPEMGGQEVFEHIQKGALVPPERLMFLTVDRSEPIRQFLASTNCYHLYKPLELKEFLEQVHAMLSVGQPAITDRTQALPQE